MATSTSAFAQSPAEAELGQNGEVLDVVQGGGSDTTPSGGGSDTAPSGGGNKGTTTPATQEKGTTAAAPAVSSGQLPFTGFQAGLVALAGVALVGAGVAMRRVAKHD